MGHDRFQTERGTSYLILFILLIFYFNIFKIFLSVKIKIKKKE